MAPTAAASKRSRMHVLRDVRCQRPPTDREDLSREGCDLTLRLSRKRKRAKPAVARRLQPLVSCHLVCVFCWPLWQQYN